MKNNKRTLYLDVFDYSNNKLCSLYDNASAISGQATDVYVNTERNGWKELTFTLPSVIITESGTEHNYRLDYLKADYLIRLIDDFETDWFVISEPKVIHNAFSKNVQVTAGHISQRLKNKNLGLEFSDDEGNNVGTAQQLAQTILDGTGWSVGYVYPFAEKDGSTKYRSLKASAKTGAFKLMTTMCDLFDAKPIYHGESKTVDIIPINPFSEPAPGALPDLSLASDVIELYYGKNVSNVTRTLNTENIVTKMYAYGAYGDKTSGYCGIDECMHTEYSLILTEDCPENQAYYFTLEDDAGISLTYSFVAKSPMISGSKLIYSLLDPSSMMYVWDDNNQKAYPVTKETNGTALPATITADKDVQNWFQSVMNFDYYRDVGLLTDEMIQIIAEYQRNAPVLYQAVADASSQMSKAQTVLSETIGYIDFCKLDVKREEVLLGDGYTVLELNKDQYPDGVVYRSDYDKNKDNYFKWRVTESLNTDGDPTNSAAGLVYIVHDTDPVTWDKAYLKAIDNEDDPTYLTLWAKQGSMRIEPETDQFFLFSYNGINGYLGALESSLEAAEMSIQETLRVATADHPVYFIDIESGEIPSLDGLNGYGWAFGIDSSGHLSLFGFAYPDIGDSEWQMVAFTDGAPSITDRYGYWFDFRHSKVYRRESDTWRLLDAPAEKKVAALFGTVCAYAATRERCYHGVYETYSIPFEGLDAFLPAGNYLFANEYASFLGFTISEMLDDGDSLTYEYKEGWITQIKDGVETKIKPKMYNFDNVKWHAANVHYNIGFESGKIDDNGSLIDDDTYCRSQSFVPVVPSTQYNISGSDITPIVHFYDEKKNWLSCEETGWVGVDTRFFDTPGTCAYVRLCYNVSRDVFTSHSDLVVTCAYAEYSAVINDTNYFIISYKSDGEIVGLFNYVNKFSQYADLTYDTYYGQLKAAQNALSSLEQEMILSVGDLYREGWWQDASYVDGDEKKLYEDALENLKQVAKPEATYNITFLDLFGSNEEDKNYGAASETMDVEWPDLQSNCAVHLVDPEISVNTWAFFDKIQKCYDKPKQTKISINTNLSTIAQHSFTDVMTNIASVASEMKGKSSYYDKTIASAATNEDLEKVYADISKNIKDLFTTSYKITEVGDTVITQSSRITKNEEEIIAEVERSTNEEKKLSAQLKINAEEISAEVARATDKENELSASLKINSDEISAEVTRATNKEEELSASIKVNTDEIAAEVKRATGKEEELSSSIKVNSDSIAAEVERAKGSEEKLSASIKINEENITSEVKRATESEETLSTRITQTAEGLTSRVDGIENSSIFAQTEEAVQAIIRDNSNGENAFNTTSVSISKSGVAIATNGTFTVDSGNFDVDENGKVSAHDAFISGELYHNGSPVLTSRDIVVSETQPTSPFAGMIWIKPITQEDSGSSGSDEEIETIESVEAIYSNTCSSLGWASRSYIGSSYSTGKSGTLYGSGRSTTLTNCTYTVQIPLHLGYTTVQNTNVMCKLTGENGKFVEFAVPVSGTGEKLATGVFQSSIWIGTGDTVSFQICTSATGTYSNVLNSKAGAAEFKVTCDATA